MSEHVTFTAEAQRVIARFHALPARILQAIAGAMDQQNVLTVSHIQQRYMSQRGPDTLGVITNRLRGSVRASKATISGQTVSSSIGSNVAYMGVHEYGFDGQANIPAHTRIPQARVKPSGMGATVSLAIAQRMGVMTKSGKVRKGAGQMVQSGPVNVKAHTRHMNIKKRAPLRRGIADRLQAYGQAISQAIVQAAAPVMLLSVALAPLWRQTAL